MGAWANGNVVSSWETAPEFTRYVVLNVYDCRCDSCLSCSLPQMFHDTHGYSCQNCLFLFHHLVVSVCLVSLLTVIVYAGVPCFRFLSAFLL